MSNRLSGGGNLIEKISCKNRIGYDNNYYLIEFWKAIQGGWNPSGIEISKELYQVIKDYYDEAVRNVLKQAPAIRDVEFDCRSYSDIQCEGCLIYCDPPYEGTTKYIDNFNHLQYWEWVRKASRKNIVICSEYHAPEDFSCIWEMETVTTLDKSSRNKAVERLFVLNRG